MAILYQIARAASAGTDRTAMNIPHALSLLIRRSHSMTDLLDETVELVAREMGTDVCSIYLLDAKDHRLRLMATKGLDPAALGKVVLSLGEGLTGIVVSEMRSLAVEDASTHPGFRYFPETREERFHSYLGVPLAIRNRPVGAIVVQTCEKRQYSREEIETLTTISAQLVGVVENARLVNAIDRGEAGRGYLDEIKSWNQSGAAPEEDITSDLHLKGSAASPGIVIGEALFRGSYDLRGVVGEPYRGAAAEKERLVHAMERTRADILRIQEAAQREADEEHALIFSSHLLLLSDPTLTERIGAAIAAGATAAQATFATLAEIEEQLQGVRDSYIQDRAEDVRDLRGRLLGHLLEEKAPTPHLGNEIVVTSGIPPSLVVELKAQGARAIVTERGGLTSHGALLARSMGIPAVTGIPGLLRSVRSGDPLIVDGGAGLAIARPSAATLDRYRSLEARTVSDRARWRREANQPACTPDGVRVPLLANIGLAADLHRAVENGAEGIGLYRTEFPFMIREGFPTREEQTRIYRRVYDSFPDGPVNFRLLDLGGDKFMPTMSRAREPNPQLGFRSLRILLEHHRVLQDQVCAFLKASAGRPMAILLPMVGSLSELRRAKELIRSAIGDLPDKNLLRDPPIGVMIEMPAAVEIAPHLARECGFFSIGSNDLTQFTLAVDRENERVARLADPFHPAVLSLIGRTISAGKAAGIPVSLCGEMGANPAIAVLLVAMGIDSLSLGPNAIPEVKEMVRKTPVGPLRGDLDRILSLPEAAMVREAVERHLAGA
jgi:phosphotransferase system enzyme I (PtsP)